MKLKQLISILLSVFLLTAIIPLSTLTISAETTSGSCGDNITWEYDDSTYTLTISGTGAMSDYSSSSYNGTYVTTAPWQSYYETMKSVVINSGVTSIGERAFYGCTGLTSVTILDSVTSIGMLAFYGCTGLTSVTIPDSVTSIGSSAFSYCTGLTSVTIPDSATTIGDYVFYNCSRLTSVTIPDSVTSIGDGAFYGCTGLTSVTIGDSVTSIGERAFYNCTGLKKVNYTGSITDWCKIVFSSSNSNPLYYAHNLYIDDELVTDLIIPDSVTSIGNDVFSGCTGLTSVTIPDSVTSIGDWAFSGCTGLKKVNYTGSITDWCKIVFSYSYSNPLCYAHNLYIDDELVTDLIIPDSVTSIGDWAFCGCTGLTSVTIPDSVTKIGDSAFNNCTGLTSVTIPDSVTKIGDSAFNNCTGLTSVTIPDSVTSIGDWAFYNCTGLTSVTIGDLVTSIGYEAFYGCTGLTSVTIPDSVTSIGDWAFNNCTGLTSVTIGDSVTSIGWGAFCGCTGLTSVTIPDSVTSIGDYAFYGCSIKNLIIADGSKTVTSAMVVCKGTLENVTIPDSVTSIGERAFYGCNNLQYNIYKSGKYLGNENNPYLALIKAELSAFATSFEFANNIKVIYDSAFRDCTGLTSVTIPDSVTKIGDSAFNNCTGLTSVTIGDSVTSIGNYAFSGCTGLTSVTIGDSVTSIGIGAFSYCTGLTSVTIPDSVTEIGNRAFYGCAGLTSVTIGDSVTEIGINAFSDCTGLKKVNYTGSITDWCKIVFSSSDSNPLYYAHNLYIDDELVTDLIIPDSVTSIGNYAFCGCTGLTSVTIPDSVTTIGDYAFCDCTEFKKVNYTGSITDWCKIVFSYSYSNPLYYAHNLYIDDELVTDLIIPDSVTSIGNYAFYGCTGLTSVTIPDSVTSIGYEAFYNCTGLTSVHYQGTARQWDIISIDSGNTPLTNAARTYCTPDEWVIRTAPTCTETGVEYGTCTVCGEEIARAITALGHNYVNNVDDKYLKSAADCTHSKVYYKSCALCGKKSDETFECAKPLGHNYVNNVDDKYLKSAADCTHGNIYYKSCSRCGEKSSETFESDIYMPCGANCGFIIKDNILYIHGFGETSNWKTQGSVPWYDYADSITDIVIDEGITNVGNYAFYCLENVKNIKSKNSDLYFGKYAINGANSNITVLAENGGDVETYCAENGINYIDPTITPEVETVTANSITVKAVEGYEYSKDGTTWQKSNKFTGLSPASEYNIYARYAAAADIFDTVGTPLIVTTLKSTVAAPAAPDYQSHTENSITLAPNDLYEFSLDGENWQKSSEFTGLSKNTIYRFYRRVAETETEYASAQSKPLIIALPSAPVACANEDVITVKAIEGFEYCLDDMLWQDSPVFDKLIDNMDYTVYQRLKTVSDEKVYQIKSAPTTIITDSSLYGHNYNTAVTAPTCTEQGYTTYTCENCGDSYVDDYTEATGHSAGAWASYKTGHWHICTVCGEKFDETEHTPGEWITDNEALPGIAGSKHKECTVCGYITETGEIPALPTYIPGDISGDGSLNNKDLTRLFQYLSDWDVEVDEAALDVNGDGSVNNKDLTRLFQYLSDWDVEIF